jgi:hypothetical protein
MAGWYAVPGERRFAPDAGDPRVWTTPEGEEAPAERDRAADRARMKAVREEANRFTLPPEAVLVRRMFDVVAIVLGQLRAGGDWGGIVGEVLHGDAPVTPLGEAEAAFFAGPQPVRA